MATNDLLRRMARLGAMRRIEQLRDEANEILSQFPELGRAGTLARRASEPAASADTVGRKRKRRKMTAAQRTAVGERMKKYWEARRAAGKTARKK